jgi:hypothetical protein
METFLFFIPNGVIAEMGLLARENTFIEQVRISDMLDEGKMSMNEYHALASAGVAFIDVEIISFLSVEETLIGWVCRQGISLDHREARTGTVSFLLTLFPEGQPLFEGGIAGDSMEWVSLTPEMYEAYERLAPLVGSEIVSLVLSTTILIQEDVIIFIDSPRERVFYFDLKNPNSLTQFGELSDINHEVPEDHVLVAYGFVKY